MRKENVVYKFLLDNATNISYIWNHSVSMTSESENEKRMSSCKIENRG